MLYKKPIFTFQVAKNTYVSSSYVTVQSKKRGPLEEFTFPAIIFTGKDDDAKAVFNKATGQIDHPREYSIK